MRKIQFSLLTMPTIFIAAMLLHYYHGPAAIPAIVGVACLVSYTGGLLQGFRNSEEKVTR